MSKRKLIDPRTLPPSTNGFAASYLCHESSHDCLNGSCWHMGVMRMMIDRWFARLNPTRVQPDPEPRPVPERKRTKDEIAAAELAYDLRRMAWDWLEKMHPIDRTKTPNRVWGEGSVGCYPALDGYYCDRDGTGSWGRIVRAYEDWAD